MAHPQRAVLVQPTKIRPGDKVCQGRGPWARVTEVRPAKGRPTKNGKQVLVVTPRGPMLLLADRHVRVVRSG